MRQADAAGLEQRIAEKVGDGSAESQSVVPVLREESKTATLWDMAMIWAGAQLIVGTWAVGALATVVFGLNLSGAISAIVFGNVLGGLMVGATSMMGKHGAPQMLLMRYGLGAKGSNITSFFNFVSSIGWFSFNTVLTTLAIFQVFKILGIEAGVGLKALVLVLILVLQVLFGLTNFGLMKRVEAFLVIPTALFVVLMTFFALQGVDWSAPATGPAEGGGFNYWSMWISAAGAVGIAYWGRGRPTARTSPASTDSIESERGAGSSGSRSWSGPGSECGWRRSGRSSPPASAASIRPSTSWTLYPASPSRRSS